MIWVVAGIVIVVVGLGLIVWSRRRTPDGVATFQRQIDALSPEARRGVVDQVHDLDGAGNATADQPPDDGTGRGVDGA